MNDPAIKAGDAVYALQPDGSLKQVSTATGNGTVTVSFSTDPAFVVTPPVAGYWVAGPTDRRARTDARRPGLLARHPHGAGHALR
ncbi:MAG: hypothetical protein M0Z42_16995 [Actinomycetota bacterium]|nr:hypothetical protein [Actinomycetota bacterium]